MKPKAGKAKITVRDLGTKAKKGLDKATAKKVHGGTRGGCEWKGERCGTLHLSPRGYSSVLTVVIKAPIPT